MKTHQEDNAEQQKTCIQHQNISNTQLFNNHIELYSKQAHIKYTETHNRWDQMRNKIKTFKLDNFNNYWHNHNKNDFQNHHQSMFVIPNYNLSNKKYQQKQEIVVSSRNLSKRKIEKKEQIEKNYSSQQDNYIHSGNSQQVKKRAATRIYSSHRKFEEIQSKHRSTFQIPAASKNKQNFQLQKQETQKKYNNKSALKNTPKANDDLMNINKVSEQNIINRQIIKKKSDINQFGVDLIEASLLFIHGLKNTKTLIMFILDRVCSGGGVKSSKYKLVIGPNQIKELLTRYRLTKQEMGHLVNLLIDELQVEHDNLKLKRNQNNNHKQIKREKTQSAKTTGRMRAAKNNSKKQLQRNKKRKIVSARLPHPIINSKQFQKIKQSEQEQLQDNNVEQNIQIQQSKVRSFKINQEIFKNSSYSHHNISQNIEDSQNEKESLMNNQKNGQQLKIGTILSEKQDQK